MKTQNLIPCFYQGSYQYSRRMAMNPNDEAHLFEGILDELEHAYLYNNSIDTFWCSVFVPKEDGSNGQEICRLSRVDKESGIVTRFNGFDTKKFVFHNLKNRQLTFVKGVNFVLS